MTRITEQEMQNIFYESYKTIKKFSIFKPLRVYERAGLEGIKRLALIILEKQENK